MSGKPLRTCSIGSFFSLSILSIYQTASIVKLQSEGPSAFSSSFH